MDERGAVATVAAERDGRGVSLSRHLGRELGLTRWYANHIQSLIETKAVLQVEIKEPTPHRRAAQGDDVGVVLHEESRAEVRGPAQGDARLSAWTVGGRPAVPLSSE